MRKLYQTLLLVSLSLPGFVSADELRVLLSFSADDHRVEKVFTIESSRAAPRVLQSRIAQKGTRSGVLVEWLDSNGSVLADEIIADPRITHAPTKAGPIPDKFLKPKGVYLVNGPVSSTQLRLSFPAVNLSTQPIPASDKILSLTPN